MMCKGFSVHEECERRKGESVFGHAAMEKARASRLIIASRLLRGAPFAPQQSRHTDTVRGHLHEIASLRSQ